MHLPAWVGTIADIAGILSFLMSIVLFIISHSIFKNIEKQRSQYNNEREKLLSSLLALRQNVFEDDLCGLELISQIRTCIFEYQQKYWKISSIRCIVHSFKCLYRLKKGITEDNKRAICGNLDYLIARLKKKEFSNHEQQNSQ
ncbi:hypothetical protein DW091_06045 [Eubacterium sp. AM05-23]|nr:hypothetical protein DW091_06045 [Eubacterium sp. AM05-23]